MTENWKSSVQVAKAVNKANQALGRIKRTFTYMNKDIFMKTYPSLVRSHLEYAVQAWSPRLKKDIDHLEKVQRRATKLVPECRTVKYKDRLRVLGLITLSGGEKNQR